MADTKYAEDEDKKNESYQSVIHFWILIDFKRIVNDKWMWSYHKGPGQVSNPYLRFDERVFRFGDVHSKSCTHPHSNCMWASSDLKHKNSSKV